MNQFRDHASKVLDEFLEVQEDLKSYILEGLSQGLSLEDVYDTLDEGSPISRRDFLRLGASMAAQIASFGGLTAAASALTGRRGPKTRKEWKDAQDRFAAQRKSDAEENRLSSQAEMKKYNNANPPVNLRKGVPVSDNSKL